MTLVAKEFVAARDDEDGALLLWTKPLQYAAREPEDAPV